MTITPADIKASLRIDVSDDDAMIQQYIDSAANYIQTAVSATEEQLNDYNQYWFAVSLLTQFWYQNRAIDMKNTPYQVVSMIQQLRGLIS
ncbi:head-tail connector protein [Liquorilactobacillus capillatus]|uniref:Prophage Lp3 protein 19, head-to-tail joining n=1 Tax=Liquorilactobacillus capillatus DSM 19910 TaxID=1423731 RepID=A0A0R1LXS9_9LACO|nr:head-tail connector protein [Liquorilactobacillus capillatus]KRL00431.1 prophage Lp3 protein 19, head-to-tail joining [Liquorilactobacillus capillatus DSM 19910]